MSDPAYEAAMRRAAAQSPKWSGALVADEDIPMRGLDAEE